jgi:hypothetical protein
MALTKYTGAINTIQNLSDRPNQNEGLTAAQLKLKFDKSAIDMQTYIDDTLTVELDALDSANVKKTGEQNIAGVKTFSSSPIVPTPTEDMQASTKKYVDDKDTNRKIYVDNNFETKASIEDNRKLSDTGNFTGSWFGITNPALAEPGIAGVVEQHTEQLAEKAQQNDLNTTNANVVANTNSINTLNAQVSTNTSNITANASNIATQKARIDSFTTLAAGSTTGDAELIDARIGTNGITYSNAGSAVRGQISELKLSTDQRSEIYTNLFNSIYLTRANGWSLSNGEYSGAIYDLFAKYGSSTQLYPLDVALDASTQYTLSFKAYTNANVSNSGVGLKATLQYTDGTSSVVQILNNVTTYTQFNVVGTAGKTLQGIYFSYGSSGGNIWHIKEIQLEKGTTVTAYKVYKPAIDERARDSINTILTTSDSPFTTSVTDEMKGIKAFYFFDDKNFPFANNQKYRVSKYYYKKSGFYLYVEVQVYINGIWSGYDSIEIYDTATPIETAVMTVQSKYSRFKCAFIPSLLLSYSSTSLNYEIKYTSISYMLPQQQKDIDSLKLAKVIEDFGFKDKPKYAVTVDANGNGDYTTIAAAYAAITDSDFDNQYDIRVLPGVYNEMNLVPPPFTHTHGLHPNTVTVTGVGLNNPELSIFDLIHTSKLSNMIIIATENMRYTVHFDSGDSSRFVICENLYCKKVYGATTDNPLGVDVRNNGWLSYSSDNVIGMGMSGAYQIAFINCVFENGLFAPHTNANVDSKPDAKIILDGCKLVNSYIRLQTAGTVGQYPPNGKFICNIKNLITQMGKLSLEMSYYGVEQPWTVLGVNNKNFNIKFTDLNGTSYEAWKNINTTDKGYIQLASAVSVLKGQWIDYNGNICNNSSAFEVFGVALEDKAADAKESVMVWVGNAYPYTATNGEYGIGADGKLSASATTKIGKVINNIFYRY